MNDDLGDEMKRLETINGCLERIDRNTNIYARVDGRSFHTWVKKMRFGFANELLSQVMASSMQDVAEELDADVAYCQSDEVSFGWFAKANPRSEHVFGGRKAKLNSVIPSLFAGYFMKNLVYKATDYGFHAPKPYPMQSFDCRTLGIYDRSNFQRMFYWRYLDARRNAVQGLARQYFSHKKLQGLSQKQMIEMLEADGHGVDQMPGWYREGSFFVADKHLPDGVGFYTKELFVKTFDFCCLHR